MKFNNLILVILTVMGHSLYAQTNLVQTITEANADVVAGWGARSITYANVNGDAYDDLVIGAGEANTDGSVFIYYGGPTLDGTVDITLNAVDSDTWFAEIIANAGDLNNDGYDDLLVSAPRYNEGAGRIYVYLGGTSMDATPDLVLDPDTDMENFNYISLAGAGDVNHDGYDDFLLGVPLYNNLTGMASIYLGGATLNSTPDYTFYGNNEGDLYGERVCGAGDVNNDNYDDVLIGACKKDNYTGEAQLFLGGASISSTPAQTLTGENENDDFSWGMAGNLDVNNDGYDDVVVSSDGYDYTTGRIYIYFGSASFDATADVSIDGNNPYEQFGSRVSSAGDMNNDNYDDILVTAVGENNEGMVYVFLGGSSMDTYDDFYLEGSEEDEKLGCTIAGGGDMNNDGYDDIVIGSAENVYSTFYAFQGSNPLDDTVDMTIQDELGMVPGKYNAFGKSIANAGDVNNDGYDDMIVGATNYDEKGAAYIYYGGPGMDYTADVILVGYTKSGQFGCAVAGAGDVNNDGYDDVLVGASDDGSRGKAFLYLGGSNMDSTPDASMEGQYNGNFGHALDGVGDVNSDGYDDFIICTNSCNIGSGRAYLYYGAETVDGTADDHWQGSLGEYYGSSVSSGGDFNGDGHNDVIISSRSLDGYIYIYRGGSSFSFGSYRLITGPNNNDRWGHKARFVGDVNNDGFDDIMVTNQKGPDDSSSVFLILGNNSDDYSSDLEFKFMYEDYSYDLDIGYVGDLNDDGFDDIVIGDQTKNRLSGQTCVYLGGSTVDNIADAIIYGNDTNDHFGCAIAGVGDIDNDGHIDFMAGAYAEGDNGTVKQYYLSDDMVVTGVKVFLQGAYDADAVDPVMTTELAGSIPTTSPYSDSRTVSSVPDSVVDWVWLELRSTQDGAAEYGRSYFLQNDGYLVDDDTSKTILDLSSQVAPGDYYMVIKHRNHLCVESAAAQTLSSSMSTYNFASSLTNYLESNAATLEAGVYGMYVGDCGCDGIITNADKDPINANIDATGYQTGDTNMDGLITNADKDFINSNMDASSSVNNE